MNPTSAAPSRWWVGAFAFDSTTGVLQRDDARVRLPDQAAAALTRLLETPGELVTREQLVARLWPRTTYVDTEAGLNTAIKKLRIALGDDADRPTYVETVPRRGYRLIATVSAVGPNGPPPVVEAEPPSADGAPASNPAAQSPPVLPTPAASAAPARRAWLALLLLVPAAAVWFALPRSPGPATRPDPPSGPLSGPHGADVAVLPFANLTGDATRDFVALGLAENLLQALAERADLVVIARTSSFAVDARAADPGAIGRRLGARYLVEGSVQGPAGQLRINVRLIDTSSNAATYTRTLDQRDVAATSLPVTLANEIAAALSLAPAAAAPSVPGTADRDAWLAYEQGRVLASQRRRTSVDAAVERLEAAVALDPRFVAARIELAHTYVLQAIYRPIESPDVTARALAAAGPRVEAQLAAVLRLNPASGEAHVIRGLYLSQRDERGVAERELRAGLALAPNSARGHLSLAELLTQDRRTIPEAMTHFERARRLDPLEPRVPYYQAVAEMQRDRPADAERLLQQTLELRPDYAPALARLGLLAWRSRGAYADAIKFGELARRYDPEVFALPIGLVPAYVALGEHAAVRALLPTEPSERARLLATRPAFGATPRSANAYFARNPLAIDPCDRSLDGYLLVAHARASGDYAGPTRGLAQAARIDLTRDPAAVPPDSAFAATLLAELVRGDGRAAQADALLAAALALVTAHADSLDATCVHAARTRARALALLGREDAALAALTDALHAQHAWFHAAALLNTDPAYERLRRDPRFKSLQQEYARHVEKERQLLAALRARGAVPTAP